MHQKCNTKNERYVQGPIPKEARTPAHSRIILMEACKQHLDNRDEQPIVNIHRKLQLYSFIETSPVYDPP